MNQKIAKLNCFTEKRWKEYKELIPANKGSKQFDVCYDCTSSYQSSMGKEGKCEFPLKRIDKIPEFS